MLAYIVRRVLYAVPILIGVNLITFALFFLVNTPDDMARMQLGTRRVTAEAIEKWKAEQGYDKPNTMARNGMKYLRIDPARRAELREQWNAPRVLPLALILLALAVSAIPAAVSYRRRERMAARPAG